MNIFLLLAGTLSGVAGLLHLACIYFGGPWYRFFGAGEQMAQLAEQGSLRPTLITLGITSVLAIWSLYAFSAAGVIGRFPFIKTVLVVITSIYLLRGVAGFLLINNPMGRSAEFWIWSSIICLVLGLLHLFGLKQQWANL